MEMGRQTEALVQFHHCLKLQTDFAPAKGQIKKVSSSDARMCQTQHVTLQTMSHRHDETLNSGLKYE